MKLLDIVHEPFFQFLARTKIVFGAGSRSEIEFEFKELNARKIMLCTDQGLIKAGVIDMIEETFKDFEEIKLVARFDGGKQVFP